MPGLRTWRLSDGTFYNDADFEAFLKHSDETKPPMFKWLQAYSPQVRVMERYHAWFERSLAAEERSYDRTVVGERPHQDRNAQFWEITVYNSGPDISFGFGEMISLGPGIREECFYFNRFVGKVENTWALDAKGYMWKEGFKKRLTKKRLDESFPYTVSILKEPKKKSVTFWHNGNLIGGFSEPRLFPKCMTLLPMVSLKKKQKAQVELTYHLDIPYCLEDCELVRMISKHQQDRVKRD